MNRSNYKVFKDRDGTWTAREYITRRLIVEGAVTEADAWTEVEAFETEMHRFNDGPFSVAQSTA